MINPLTLPLPGLLMRLAVVISFVYPAVAALFDPYAWLGYFPGFLLSLAGAHELLLLHAWGIFEIALALWVLFATRVYIPSIIMAALLMAVVLLNLPQFDVLFRDISIALAALSLAAVNWKKYGTA